MAREAGLRVAVAMAVVMMAVVAMAVMMALVALAVAVAVVMVAMAVASRRLEEEAPGAEALGVTWSSRKRSAAPPLGY